MISVAYNFIFIHVGKNGGNSISKLISPYVDNRIVCTKWFQDGKHMFDVEDPLYRLRKHASLIEYKQVLDTSFYKSCFKFAVVRNPYDRLISIYYAPNKMAQGKVNPDSFNKRQFLNIIKKQRTFREFVKTKQGGRLDDEMDYIARFENLNADIKKIFSYIGLPDFDLEKINSSTRISDYRTYYDEEMKKAVYEKFCEEIEYFGYSF